MSTISTQNKLKVNNKNKKIKSAHINENNIKKLVDFLIS